MSAMTFIRHFRTFPEIAILTCVAHRRLPYRRMLIATGLMLAFVMLVGALDMKRNRPRGCDNLPHRHRTLAPLA
jgi:hypothetical protein